MELKGLGTPIEPMGCACCVGGGVNPRNSGGQGAGFGPCPCLQRPILLSASRPGKHLRDLFPDLGHVGRTGSLDG